jgi:hypothetical protein
MAAWRAGGRSSGGRGRGLFCFLVSGVPSVPLPCQGRRWCFASPLIGWSVVAGSDGDGGRHGAGGEAARSGLNRRAQNAHNGRERIKECGAGPEQRFGNAPAALSGGLLEAPYGVLQRDRGAWAVSGRRVAGDPPDGTDFGGVPILAAWAEGRTCSGYIGMQLSLYKIIFNIDWGYG